MQTNYKISGVERKALKKELAHLKTFVSKFWYYNDIDEVYGGGLSTEEGEKELVRLNKQIEDLENKLNETW